jgi:hypothetical protein
MYWDLVLLVALILIGFLFFKRFSNFVYLMVFTDILFRVLRFISNNIGLKDVSNVINKYIPDGLAGVAARYVGTGSIIYTIAVWAILVLYVIFEFYLFRLILKRGRR